MPTLEEILRQIESHLRVCKEEMAIEVEYAD
jgi:hypothetical protein